MTTIESIVKTLLVTNVAKLSSLDEGYAPGWPFKIFVNPKEESDISKGDILTVDAELYDNKGESVEVPVITGEWSPVVFRSFKDDAFDLTEVDVYVARILMP